MRLAPDIKPYCNAAWALKTQRQVVAHLTKLGRAKLGQSLASCSATSCCKSNKRGTSPAGLARQCYAACPWGRHRASNDLIPVLEPAKWTSAFMTTVIDRRSEFRLDQLPRYNHRSLKETLRRRMEKVWQRCPGAIAYGVVDFEVYWRRGRWWVRPHTHLIVFPASQLGFVGFPFPLLFGGRARVLS